MSKELQSLLFKLAGLLLLAFAVWILFKQNQSLRQQNQELKTAVETQTESIKKLDEAREKDSKAMDEIRASQVKTAKSTADVLRELNKLGSTNDEIKKFLGMSVPADLGRVLNNARTRNSNTDTVKSSLEGLSRP